MPSFPGFGPNPAAFVETPKATKAPPLSTHLVDNFNDNAINTAQWPNNYGTTTEANGRARTNADNPGDSAYRSARRYSFDAVYVQVPTVTQINGGGGFAYTLLGVETDPAGTDLVIAYEGQFPRLALTDRIGFVHQSPVYLTYDPVQHAWWRIRRSGGNVVFETAPDGHTWTSQNTITAPDWANGGDIGVILAAGRDSGTADFSEFDNLNYLPVSTLSDNFDDNSIDTSKWAFTNGTVTETGGRVRIDCSTGYQDIESAFVYSFDSVHAQVFPAALNGGDFTYTAMAISSAQIGGGNDVLVQLDAGAPGSLHFGRRTAGTFVEDAFITYDAVQHAWWRLRHTGVTCVFDTAPDNHGAPGTWTQQASISSPVWIDNPDCLVLFSTGRGTGTANFTEIDNVNLTGIGRTPILTIGPATTPHPSWRRPNNALVSRPLVTADIRAQGGTCALGLAVTGTDAAIRNLATSLVDDFDDNSVDTSKWFTNGSASETNQRARLSPPSPGDASYLSFNLYSLDSAHVRVPTVSTINGGAGYSYTALITGSGSQVAGTDLIAIYEGQFVPPRLTFCQRIAYAQQTPVSVSYDPVQHAWWRIRRSAGNVLFETAPDDRGAPGTWTTQNTIADPSWAGNHDFYAQIAAGRDTGTADFSEFDNFNVTPTPGLPPSAVTSSQALRPHPSWRATNHPIRIAAPIPPPPVPEQGTAAVGLAATGTAVKIAPQGGTSALGLTGTGQQTSVEFTRTPYPVTVTPPSTRYPSLGRPNAAQISKAPPPIQVANQQGTCALGVVGTGQQTSVAFTRAIPVYVTPPSSIYPSLRQVNARIFVRIPAIPISFEQGTTAVGLTGTGSQTSVEFTRTPNPVTVVPGRTYPRPLLTPNQRLVVRIPPPPPLVPPEQGSAVVGFATTAAPVTKTVQVGGTCSLGLAASGRAAKLAPAAGVISVGISGTCSARKVAPHVGVASAGLFVTSTDKKLAVERGLAPLGLIGRVSTTIVRPVSGTTSMLLLPLFDPFAQLKKPLHAGTATNVASPDHAGAITDVATHRNAGAAQDTVVSQFHAGTPS